MILRSDYTDIIKVTIVGDGDEKTFAVYEDLICSRSKTVRDFHTNAASRTNPIPPIKIKHERAGDFQIYIDVILSDINNLTEFAETEAITMWAADPDEPTPMSDAWKLEAMIWVLTCYWRLGKALGDAKFQNLAMDTLLWQDASRFPAVTLKCAIRTAKISDRTTYVWDWAVDCVARKATDETIATGTSEWPTHFVIDVMEELIRLRGSGKLPGFPRYQDRLRYHEEY